MIPLLIGLVCFLAALRVAGWGMEGDVRNRGAVAWLGLIAVLTLGQLWLGRDALERYRFTLLGFRYRLVEAEGVPRPDTVVVSGDDAADLWVPGAGEEPSLELVAEGGEGPATVTATLRPDAGAVALVEDRGGLSSSWQVLGGVPLQPGDAMEVAGSAGTWTLRLETVADRLSLPGGGSVPLPWVGRPRLQVTAPSGSGGSGATVTVTIPPLEGSVLGRLTGRRPSVFQRTYPLADVLQAVADSAGAAPDPVPLTSFFYWSEGDLHLAALDSEVRGPGSPAPLPVWSGGEGGRRLLVAGLAHRDQPEPDLTLPERYGIRPLRTFRLSRNGPWLDAALASPEVRVLDRAALEELRLEGDRDLEGRPLYRIRLTPGRNAPVRQAVVFDAAPDPFGAAGQAVLRLPEDTRAGTMDVLAPAGLARWETGRPLSLGTGDRALLVRVDGLGTSAGWWLVHGAAFLLVGLVFLRRPMRGPVFALALTATGLVALRLLLGVSALADSPNVQEGQQIALWLLPFLPWALVTLAETGRTASGVDRSAAEAAGDGSLAADAPATGEWPSWRSWLHPVLHAVAVSVLGVALFAGSPAKQLVAVALPAAVVLVWLLAATGWPARRPPATGGAPGSGNAAKRGARPRAPFRPAEAVRSAARRHPLLASGWGIGLALLMLRAVLDGLGWREQMTLGGTRIGVSVIYTPLVVLALAWLLHRHDGRLRHAVAAGGGVAGAASRALLDVGGFLLLAVVAVGAWVSDFGIPLVLLPGALLLLALVGVLRAPGGRTGRATVLALGFPLVLFLLVQTAPPLLRFAWNEDLRRADLRMGEWNRNELLLLERGDPQALGMIGQRRSEALAIMRETMRSYTRGNLTGKGFLHGRVGDEIAETAAREHTVSALLASQWGLPGTTGLLLLLVSLLPPVGRLLVPGNGGGGGAPGREVLLLLGLPLGILAGIGFILPSPWNAAVVGLVTLAAAAVLLGPAFGVREAWWWGGERHGARTGDPGARAGEVREPATQPGRMVAATALVTVAAAGVYMILANYGVAFFTGKNVYLLGLDSVGDALEGTALLGMAALALGRTGARRPSGTEAGGPGGFEREHGWREEDDG